MTNQGKKTTYRLSHLTFKQKFRKRVSVKSFCFSCHNICFHKTHYFRLVYQMFMYSDLSKLRSIWRKSFFLSHCKIISIMVRILTTWLNALLYHHYTTKIEFKVWHIFKIWMSLIKKSYFSQWKSKEKTHILMNIRQGHETHIMNSIL